MTDYEEDQNALAEELVAPLIQVMQSGKLPWRQPWSAKGLLGQHNLYTGLSYNGFNVMFLMVAKHCSEYEHSAWLTRRQGRELKWTLRPGAKGCRILKPVFRSPNQVRIDPETGKPMVDRWGNEVKGAHASGFKSSIVFNASDFREGSDSVKTVAELLPKPVETPEVEARRIRQTEICPKSLGGMGPRGMSGDLRLSEGLLFLQGRLDRHAPDRKLRHSGRILRHLGSRDHSQHGTPLQVGQVRRLRKRGVLCLRRTSGGIGKLHLVR